MSELSDRLAINTLFAGNYADPFSLLGMHQTANGLEVRALLPDALEVWVIETNTGRKVAQLKCLDPRGFFSTVVPRCKNMFRYQLAVDWHGQQNLIDDAYRFDPLLQEMDAWLLAEGTHLRPYETLGAHGVVIDGVHGTRFSVWAPNAQRVSVVGDFNFWDGRRHPMRFRREIGIWELFVPGAFNGQLYKFEIVDNTGQLRTKADPYAFEAQMRPQTASMICGLPPKTEMSEARKARNAFDAPISVKELAEQLVPYVKEMGFTHIELLPINEHPFDGSWGYQPLGMYAPTRRFGTRDEFLYFVNAVHEAGLNVLLDWVPGHFPSDDFGLAKFDGAELYEHSDPREGYHQDWNTLIYNFGRREVSNYLAGNALYWLERFGIDGLRVDAVASMIYRDYSRAEGEWVPNHYGGRENLEAIAFLRYTNRTLGCAAPGSVTIAEDSTDFDGVSRPPESGGLGFWYKWNLGWMHDTLDYMKLDPVYRSHHHDLMNFGMMYNYTENFMLSLSHDEVVHGKKSILDRMPGDAWQKFANLRAYYGWMWAFPGKKLLFMGGEFAQGKEWNHDVSLDWHLLEGGDNRHHGVQRLVRDLNHTYRHYAPMHQLDFDPAGFEWLVVDDRENSVFVFVRRDRDGNEIIVASNFTLVPRHHYRFGVNQAGRWREVINTDQHNYHGSDTRNPVVHTDDIPSHNRPQSLSLLSTLWLVKEAE